MQLGMDIWHIHFPLQLVHRWKCAAFMKHGHVRNVTLLFATVFLLAATRWQLAFYTLLFLDSLPVVMTLPGAKQSRTRYRASWD